MASSASQATASCFEYDAKNYPVKGQGQYADQGQYSGSGQVPGQGQDFCQGQGQIFAQMQGKRNKYLFGFQSNILLMETCSCLLMY